MPHTKKCFVLSLKIFSILLVFSYIWFFGAQLLLQNWQRSKYRTPRSALTDIQRVAAGGGHSLALKTDGSIVGWGGNGEGQATPPNGCDYIAIACGRGHSLALKSDGSIAAWGANNHGQSMPPVGDNYIAIAAGSRHSLALKADGSIIGWGDNREGQATSPVGSDYVAIAAGEYHSLALRSDGSIVGWGDNVKNRATPPKGYDYVAIATGRDHSTALKSDGSVVGWGDNRYGQATPPAGKDYMAITACSYHNFALKSNGTIAGWGDGSPTPNSIPTGNDFVAIAGGGNHCLALKSDGSIRGWGYDRLGQASADYHWFERLIDRMKFQQFGVIAYELLYGPNYYIVMYGLNFHVFNPCFLMPILLGFLLGRYCNIVFRYIYAILVCLAGMDYCINQIQLFYLYYVFGNVLYLGMCLLGTFLHHKATNKKIRIYEFVDIMLIIVATVICMALYVSPEM